MGTTFTTAHIHNAQNLTKAQFKKAFTDMMKAKGYTTSDEENAALTYTLVFAPDRKWVTVLTDGADARRKAAELAKALKMHTVMIDLVDSDFAELSLFDEAGTHKDTLTLGNSYLEDAAPMGDPAAWQPLLRGSWEQVQEIHNGSYTFAEDALAQFAPLIGMDSGDILLDNDSAVNDNNAVVLHFRKAAEKKLTLNSLFTKVFGETLESLGYAKINGKPVYAKILENGILHIIACQKGKGELGESVFGIYGTVSSVYDDNMFLILKEYDGLSYIGNMHIYTFIQKYNHIDFDNSYRFSLRHFIYESPDRSLTDVMNYALEISNKYLIPEIESELPEKLSLDAFCLVKSIVSLKNGER